MAAAVVGGAGAVIALAVSFSHTSSTEFCGSCHVMQDVFEEWRASPHFVNPSGMRVGCADCHIAPGPVALVESKLRALHRVDGIYDATMKILETARADGITPNEAAMKVAEKRIDEIGDLRRFRRSGDDRN